ncbi:MAG: hypothetical protein WDL87_04320 [Candidatus Omnitrophota bacterium]|jgi:hypothetical protein
MTKEKDLLNIVLFVVTIFIVAILINYAMFIFARLGKTHQSRPKPHFMKIEEKKVFKDDREYRKIIDSSRTDYKDFMQQKTISP